MSRNLMEIQAMTTRN